MNQGRGPPLSADGPTVAPEPGLWKLTDLFPAGHPPRPLSLVCLDSDACILSWSPQVSQSAFLSVA